MRPTAILRENNFIQRNRWMRNNMRNTQKPNNFANHGRYNQINERVDTMQSKLWKKPKFYMKCVNVSSHQMRVTFEFGCAFVFCVPSTNAQSHPFCYTQKRIFIEIIHWWLAYNQFFLCDKFYFGKQWMRMIHQANVNENVKANWRNIKECIVINDFIWELYCLYVWSPMGFSTFQN